MIHVQKGPVEGQVALTQGLARLRAVAHPQDKDLGGGATQALEPVRVYTLALKDVDNADFERDSRPVSWRYVLLADDPTGVADVVEDEAGLQLAQIMRGDFAQGMLNAVVAANEVAGGTSDPIGYEMRVLEIPALASAALWLHANGRDRYFPFLVGARRNLEAAEDVEFVSRMVHMAANTPPSLPEDDSFLSQ